MRQLAPPTEFGHSDCISAIPMIPPSIPATQLPSFASFFRFEIWLGLVLKSTICNSGGQMLELWGSFGVDTTSKSGQLDGEQSSSVARLARGLQRLIRDQI